MPEKLLTASSDGLVPDPLINTNSTKPLLLEPEIELSQTADHLPASSIPRLLIERGDFPSSFVEYTSHTGPGSGWLVWSQYILGNEHYRDILTRANILQAVRLCSFLTVKLDQASLAVLLSRWSCHTHTFVASWGEFAPSLEDVCVLFHLPMFGSADSDLSVVSEEDQEIVEALRSAATEAAQCGSRFQGSVLLDSPPQCSSSKSPTYAQWYRHFFRDDEPIPSNAEQRSRRSVTGPEYGKHYELAGFLSYWLDSFIFGGKPEGGISKNVFPLAAVLSRGYALPLAPMFLGTLYYRLDMQLREDLVGSLGGYEMTSYYIFLTLFLYERFQNYAPRPKTFCKEAGICYSHAMRWIDLTSTCNLGGYIDEFENFCARPYAVNHDGILLPSFCGGPEDAVVVLKDDFSIKTLMFIAIVTNRALPCITETGEGAMVYNTCRIARQFGYDQGVPAGPSSFQGSYTSSCARFRCSRELVLRQYPASFTMPSCKRQGRYTQRFCEYWTNILKSSSSPRPLEPVPIYEDDSGFAVATTTTAAAEAQETFQPRRSKRMRMLPKTYSDFCSFRSDDERRDLSAAKGGCAADVVEEKVESPKPIEIQDSAGDRHLNSENINLNLPEAQNKNVAPASTSPGGASVPNTSLVRPLPPAREENLGPKELVQWHGYKCRFSSIPYLDCIFNKHPETFDGFRVKSAYCQRMFLDALASLIKSLAEKNFSQVTMHKINLARDLMMDCKSVGLDLSWLEQRCTDATARLAVRGLNQESARISSELQQNNEYATQLRRYLAAKEAKSASLTARCEELAEKISFQKTLIDPNISSEDKILKDLLTDHQQPAKGK